MIHILAPLLYNISDMIFNVFQKIVEAPINLKLALRGT